MANSSISNILRKFQDEYDNIAKIALSGQADPDKYTSEVPRFLYQYISLCVEISNSIHINARFDILSRLRSLCIVILKSYPSEIDSEGYIRQFFDDEVNEQIAGSKIDFTGIIEALQKSRYIKDVTDIEEEIWLYYYTVSECYIIVSNNLAYTALEQENFDMGLDLMLKNIECWKRMEYSSYYLKYQISTILINLVSLVEEDNRYESSQLLCNVAMHLENLEVEIDSNPESEQIYNYMNEMASQFMFLIR